MKFEDIEYYLCEAKKINVNDYLKSDKEIKDKVYTRATNKSSANHLNSFRKLNAREKISVIRKKFEKYDGNIDNKDVIDVIKSVNRNRDEKENTLIKNVFNKTVDKAFGLSSTPQQLNVQERTADGQISKFSADAKMRGNKTGIRDLSTLKHNVNFWITFRPGQLYPNSIGSFGLDGIIRKHNFFYFVERKKALLTRQTKSQFVVFVNAVNNAQKRGGNKYKIVPLIVYDPINEDPKKAKSEIATALANSGPYDYMNEFEFLNYMRKNDIKTLKSADKDSIDYLLNNLLKGYVRKK